MDFSKVAIIGPGLLGGSIALALRERKPQTQIAIWARRDDALEEIRVKKIADVVSGELGPVVENATLVVLCVPIGSMRALAEKIAEHISPQAMITDVGSVKAPVVAALSSCFKKRGRFIGSHPMAGSEQTGLHAARADLFEQAVCIVTPDERSYCDALAAVSEFWTMLGCRIEFLTPEEHDEIAALISHLPHLLAASLVNFVSTQNRAALDFCGNGFRDATRIASGSPAMWSEIVRNNKNALKKSLEAMIENLREVVTLLDSDDGKMNDFLTQAKATRDQHRAKK